jgi:hypothetical protein
MATSSSMIAVAPPMVSVRRRISDAEIGPGRDYKRIEGERRTFHRRS